MRLANRVLFHACFLSPIRRNFYARDSSSLFSGFWCGLCSVSSMSELDRTASSNDLPRLRPIPIAGDGRCLFRAVTHGVYWRLGKPSPNQSLQKCLADELRSKVADEFVQRRQETEWFLEGDFDHYVNKIRQPHVWGGEPELIMCSHVLRMPITVYMCTDGNKVPKIIAEYGQEYGKMGSICVLYHGYGHYDALQPPLVKSYKVF
ncbi:hypothetical protein HPP92_002721 [Vanilla planifolia]|uniref:Ubiquitin thioesterase OTU n=1 Tax=Vanilla planifolia TaxID=51239 RepID=A0A835S0F8_VANPL|nr:hypothetical protein HPP92_002721 [Vanilla planifolia]